MKPVSLFKENIIASYAAQVVAVVCNFLCSVLAARMLGPEGQGDLALYVSFTAFVTLLIGLGLPSAVVFFLASGKIEKGKIIPIVIAVTLILLAGFGILFFIAKGTNMLDVFLPDFVLKNDAWACVLLIHLLLLMLNQYFISLLQAENSFISSGVISVIGSVLLLLMYSFKYFEWVIIDFPPIYWILCSLFVTAGIQYFIFMMRIYRFDKSYFSFQPFSLAEIRPLLWFAGVAYLANIVQFLNYKMDLWFINYFYHDKEMIGVYSLAVGLAQLVWLLPNAVHSVLYTFVSSESEMQEKVLKTAKTSRLLLLYAVVVGVSGYLLSVYLVPLLFGSSFSAAPSIIGILLFGVVPLSGAMAVSAYFAGIQKIKLNLYGSVLGFVVCLILNLILIPQYGIKGAATASVFSYISTVIFYYLIFFKQKKIHLQS